MKNCYLVLFVVLALLLGGCSTAKKTGTTVKEGTVAAAKEVGDKAEDVADATADVGKKVGKKADDATTTSAIKMKFANDELVKASAIDVDTKDGYVTLTGTVRSKAEHDRAITLAKSVDGVKGVTDRLKIQK